MGRRGCRSKTWHSLRFPQVPPAPRKATGMKMVRLPTSGRFQGMTHGVPRAKAVAHPDLASPPCFLRPGQGDTVFASNPRSAEGSEASTSGRSVSHIDCFVDLCMIARHDSPNRKRATASARAKAVPIFGLSSDASTVERAPEEFLGAAAELKRPSRPDILLKNSLVWPISKVSNQEANFS